MLGAIIGDIVGSRFESNNYRNKDFEFFHKDCEVTDDSIMTLAIAKAIMETEKMIKPAINGFNNEEYYSVLEEMAITYMQKLGRKYPNSGYGLMFGQWILNNQPKPYNSFGNGAAMRISPVGIIARTTYEAKLLSEAVTGVTHNHEEGLKGAEAVAIAIYMARKGYTKEEIREEIERNYYPLNFTINEIRDTYQFNETCQGTVPHAIQAFLESTSFEDAIRMAISLGGDSDTIAAIAGSIAESYYGVPETLKEKALSYLDDELLSIYHEWLEFLGEDATIGTYHVLTKYIGKLPNLKNYGEWVRDENINQIPFLNYDKIIKSFFYEIYQFVENNPEYQLYDYQLILEKNGIEWKSDSMKNADVTNLDGQCILALILGVIRAERFFEGTLLEFFEEGYISKWLKRLKELEFTRKPIEEIHFEIGGYDIGNTEYQIMFNDSSATLKITSLNSEPFEKHYSSEEAKDLQNAFHNIHVEYWNSEYHNPYILDGTQWGLAVKYKNHRNKVWTGSNAFPENWNELLLFFEIEEN